MLRIQRALLLELALVFVLITTVVTTAVFLGSTIHLLAQGAGAVGTELLMDLLPKLLPLAFSFSLPFSWLAAVGIVLGLAPAAVVELNMRIRNSAVTELVRTRGGHALVGFNAIPHLESADGAHWVTYA